MGEILHTAHSNGEQLINSEKCIFGHVFLGAVSVVHSTGKNCSELHILHCMVLNYNLNAKHNWYSLVTIPFIHSFIHLLIRTRQLKIRNTIKKQYIKNNTQKQKQKNLNMLTHITKVEPKLPFHKAGRQCGQFAV